MDKALYWEPTTPARFINYCYDEKVLVALEGYFGQFPITITRDDLKVLEAMQTAGGGRPLDHLIAAVKQEGSIRVWWDSEARKQEQYDYQRIVRARQAVSDGRR